MLGTTRAAVDIALGVCTHPIPHPIVCLVITGSPITDIEGFGVCRMNDFTINSCPFSATGVVITSSIITDSDTLGLARQLDIVQFTYGVATFLTCSTVVDSD